MRAVAFARICARRCASPASRCSLCKGVINTSPGTMTGTVFMTTIIGRANLRGRISDDNQRTDNGKEKKEGLRPPSSRAPGCQTGTGDSSVVDDLRAVADGNGGDRNISGGVGDRRIDAQPFAQPFDCPRHRFARRELASKRSNGRASRGPAFLLPGCSNRGHWPLTSGRFALEGACGGGFEFFFPLLFPRSTGLAPMS